MVTNYCKEALADQLQANTDISDWKYVAYGTNGAASALADTALKTECSGGTYARLTATQGEGDADTYQLTGVWTNNTGAEVTIKELGVFDAVSGGNLIARLATGDHEDADKPFAEVTVPAGATLTLDAWDIVFNDDSE